MVSLNTKVNLRGYCIIEIIYLGSKTVVYRGIREKDEKPVIIKMMRNEYPTFNEIAQFRNQYNITKNLNLPNIIKTYSLENYCNGYALIMEDFGGISLDREVEGYLSHENFKQDSTCQVLNTDITIETEENTSFDLKRFFHIAIQTTAAIDALHCSRIIHKDIKPANILINPTTQEVKLTDFSIASVLPREIQSLTSPNLLEGTLTYISPEQTGRMNRNIDYRSDFYNLGVTFFELLTGTLPFDNDDLMELIHCHIAKQPPKVKSINSSIPAVLSEIVNKLMAKNAENRYQSASGLKHDLEVCWQQYQQTGTIRAFELATKDISDKFIIPETLYGREAQVKTLLTTFEEVSKGKTEMVLIAGSSGVGKTAIVNEIHKPIVKNRGYFIKGKFDQFQRDIPLSSLVQAFQDLVRQLLSETDTQIEQWKAKILSALGEQAKVITDIIPELEMIIGKQPEITELSGNAAQNRFNFLFQKFIQVFAIRKHPLVIFIDDLQWADSASLEFIELLMYKTTFVEKLSSLSSAFIEELDNDENKKALFVIGAYRDNEVDDSHPLELTIKKIEKTEKNINILTLEPLTQGELNLLIANTLHHQEATTVALTQMVFAKTRGNPFFSNVFLKSLYNDGLIQFNFEISKWEYDLNKIQALSLSDDIVEFMVSELEKLPLYTQELLKLAACIGNEFDLKILTVISSKLELDTVEELWEAVLKGFIFPESESYKLTPEDSEKTTDFDKYEELGQIELIRIPEQTLEPLKYRFLHDRIQQAAYSMIPDNQKKSIHLKIGYLLLNSMTVAKRLEKVFDLVNQFNIARELINDKTERDSLAAMNLVAGRKALASTAYAAAFEYLTIGIELILEDCNCWENNYKITLGLYEVAAEAAYLSGEFEPAEQFIEVVLAHAKTLLEKLKVYEIKIQLYGAQANALKAVNVALIVLAKLGIKFPKNPSQFDIQLELEKINCILANQQIEDLLELPEMTDVKSLAAMRILSTIIALAYQSTPNLFPLIALKQVSISLKYGNTSLSAFAYVTYAFLLSAIVKDIESSYKYGQLAVSMLPKFSSKQVDVKVIETFNQVIRHWKEHIKLTLEPLTEVYSISLEVGDLEFAAYALYAYSYHAYFIGKELTEILSKIGKNSNAIKQIKQDRILQYNDIYLNTILHLTSATSDSYILTDKIETLTFNFQFNDGITLLNLYLCRLQLFYLFAEYQEALINSEKAEQYLISGLGTLAIPYFYFYCSLVQLAIYPSLDKLEQEKIIDEVQIKQELVRFWADHAPMNYLHKYYLIEAEKCRILGKNVEAMQYYDCTISFAQEHEYLNEEALANELAGKFYLEWGKQKIAQTYMTDAYYCYLRWGATAKVNDLLERYPQLLTKVIQQETYNASPSDQISNQPMRTSVSTISGQNTFSSRTSISQSLDLAAIIKASQALSGKIEFEQLLSTLMQVVMENAGASKCVLILNKEENLDLTVSVVSSISQSESISTTFPLVSLDCSKDVPITVINYVKRTQEIFVIDDARNVASLAADRYIIQEQPKSLLCTSIIHQRGLLGILYLENNLTTGAFTRDRIEILKLLTTQAAISLENAELYRNLAQANQRLEEYNHTLKEKVEARTQELSEKNQHLEQALQNLQATQTQLIQSEKMSSLGQMVAGIAHEINNPINFIHGNITHASNYVRDLFDLIVLYQQESSTQKIKEKAEEIDLDFLLQDLPKLLESMTVGSERIRDIVLSLRNFSRLDESEMKAVNIEEGIEGTLMILQHRLKEKSDRPEIEVIKEYKSLPAVNCYAGQLNQVFMNILSNAIDALEESIAKGHYSKDKPKIIISTEQLSYDTVKIRIADNGCGIPEEVKQKIFNPFFTTKPVGSGTGLGLSISYQIVVDKHKGQLLCDSLIEKGTEFLIYIPIQQ